MYIFEMWWRRSWATISLPIPACPPVTKATFPVSEPVSSRLKLRYVMKPLILVYLGQLGDGSKYTDVGQ